ncbi:MAG: DNA topoisomerase, partial [Caulobacteraceae bacterium]
QVIGTEILDVLGFKGERLRAMFTSEDEASLRDAFEALRPDEDYAPIYQAGLARERADQIYNLSLTRAATSALVPDGVKTVLGVGRVRTPTLAIVCLREMSIASFKPATSFGLAITVKAGDTSIELRWRPLDGEAITDKATVEKMLSALVGQTARLSVQYAKKSKAGPRPADLSTLQEIAGGWGWTATKVMDVAQALYDQHKAITYVRAETRYLPERAIEAATPVLTVLQGMAPWSARPVQPLTIRKGKAGVFWDQGLNGESHHAIMPNPKTVEQLAHTVVAFSPDERRLFDVVATLFLQALAPDHQYEETTVSLEMDGKTFKAKARLTTAQGWRAVAPDSQAAAVDGGSEPLEIDASPDELGGRIMDGQSVEVTACTITTKVTKAPERFNEGSLVMAMKNAARYLKDPALRMRLQDAKGIGTQATRDTVIKGLKDQGLLLVKGGKLYPTKAGMTVFRMLYESAPEMVDPGKTAVWEHRLDEIVRRELTCDAFVDEIAVETERLLGVFRGAQASAVFGSAVPSEKMIRAALAIHAAKRATPPADFQTNYGSCKRFLDANPRPSAA